VRSTSLRVFFVLADGTPTEAHRAAVTVMGALTRTNVEPVACFLDEGPLATVCRDNLGIETIELAASARNGHAAERGVRRAIEMAIRTAHPDLVHSIGAVAHSTAGRAAERAGVPGVWTQWEAATFRSGRQLWAALVPARAVFAASRIAEACQRRVNFRRKRVILLPPGVAVSAESRAVRWARARRVLGLESDRLVLGWIAGPDPVAEAEVALRAAASVCHARASARLVVVEDPGTTTLGLPRTIRPLAAQLGIELRLVFALQAEGAHPSPSLDALDIAIYAPRHSRAAVLAPLEALAAGVPLVAADVEPIREYVTPGHDGVLVPPGDHEAFAAALLALGDAPEHRHRLSAAAGATARKQFAVNGLARRLAKTYRVLLGRSETKQPVES
jgi:glycosyltransferase involved in cell wall biosynthesis